MIKRVEYIQFNAHDHFLSLRRGSVNDPQRAHRTYYHVGSASAWRLARAINHDPRFYIQVTACGYMACIPGV